MEKLKVLDLFSGIGGFSLGLEKTGGFETSAFCEIDEHCHKVLNKHYPTIPIFKDVSTLDGNKLKNIDVICGGFPCQDISVAGKQRGLIDEHGNNTRSGLWFEYARLIREIKPRYVVIENVAALRGNGLITVLQDLRTLRYDAEWNIISARSIGACHLRERLWIIAYPSSIRRRQGTSEELCGEIKKEHRKELANIGSKKDTSTSVGNVETTHSYSEGLQGLRQSERIQETHTSPNSTHAKITNTNNIRLWESFATEKAKQEWWTKTTASQRDWWEAESSICRMDDAISDGLHEGERFRKQRIKQLGNSIVPGIVEIIGTAILKREAELCQA